MNVAGKVVLITGGARGIGAGIARVIAQAGAKAVLADRLPEDEIAKTVDEIRSAGGTAYGLQCDVSTPTANKIMVDETVRAFGRLDGFVACAAANRRGPFLDVTEEDLHFTLSATMFGVFYSCQAAARQMVAQGNGGNIVIISSVHSRRHYAGASSYNMAKAAVTSLARTIAAELAPQKIRVNTILPGWTYTPGELATFTEEQLQEGAKTIPAGRLATPEDIGHAAKYLLSDEAAYVTGTDLLVDGGITLRN
jgi:glucose 1-dehydrogenase